MTFYENGNIPDTTGYEWRLPRLEQVLSPDSNGATLDSQSLLTGPIVEVAPGHFRFPLSGGVAKTDPKDGVVMLLRWILPTGREMLYLPRNLGFRLKWPVPPAGSSGLVCAVGYTTDLGVVNSQYGGVNWDNASARPLAGKSGAYTSNKAGSSSAVDAVWKSNFVTGANNTTGAIDGTIVYTMTRNNTEGRLEFQSHSTTCIIGSTDDVYLMISLFGTGALTAMSPEFLIETYATEVPAGELS